VDMTRLADYRMVDHVTLALERGVPDVFNHIEQLQPVALGPIVETISLAWTNRSITPFVRQFDCQSLVQTIRAAREKPLVPHYGSNGSRQWGFICLQAATADVLREPLHGFELAARKAMRFRVSANKAKAKICGAFQEMVDNVLDHSGAPHTGIAGFLGSTEHFEVSVGDAGMGMLASLQSNPALSYLSDAGSAMVVGLADGNSRFGLGQDRGYGFGTLFRALNTLDADLRFRSGDYALEVGGRSLSLRNARILQKAAQQGFVVSLKLTL